MNYNTTLNSVIKEIKKEVIPELPIKQFEVITINKKANYLGYYKYNSCFFIPLIKLNKPIIQKEAKNKNACSLYDIILTTILHELAHVIQQLKNKFFNEDEAENFAYNYWNEGIIKRII